MTNIIFGTLNGALTSTSLKITDLDYPNNPFSGSSFEEYSVTGLPSFEQIEISVTPDAALGAGNGAIEIVNAVTGAVLTQNTFSGITPRKVIATLFPGINYEVLVTGANLGTYTLTTNDAGKATSIVTPLTPLDNGDGSQTAVGTVGPNSQLFPLANSIKTDNIQLSDIALTADGTQFYGIGLNATGQDALFKINPGSVTASQITQIGAVKDAANAPLSNTFNALGFSTDNKLYAIGSKSNKLYTINTATTVATAIAGDLPVGFVSSGDLVYDAAGSRFLATSKNATTGFDELWSIPVATPATATKIGTTNIGFASVTGLSFEGTKLTGFTTGTPTTVGDRIVIDLVTGAGVLQGKIGNDPNTPLNNGISGASTIATPVVTNLAPTGITFSNTLASITKSTSTATPIKVADLAAIDDGVGTNLFSLVGTDAANFEITGTSLFLKAGTVLNPATKPILGITVNVDDVTVGATPDATKAFTLAVVNDPIVPPTGIPGIKGQSATQRTIDLTDYTGILKTDIKTTGDAAFTNNIGFYAVQDAIGTIKLTNGTTLKPGDATYAVEAVKSAILQAGKIDSKLNQDIGGGAIYAPVVIAQGSLAEFATNNSTNGGGANVIHAYFNYLGANPDNFDHFKLTGTNTFAVEDMYGGGDKDFNDLVVTMNIKTATA
jgi:Domain of unknown function (DUF4114)